MVFVVLFLVLVAAAYVGVLTVKRRRFPPTVYVPYVPPPPPEKPKTWMDRGEQRGRAPTSLDEAPVAGHHAKTEPVATLHMKVTRADGTVEFHSVPAEITFKEA